MSQRFLNVMCIAMDFDALVHVEPFERRSAQSEIDGTASHGKSVLIDDDIWTYLACVFHEDGETSGILGLGNEVIHCDVIGKD